MLKLHLIKAAQVLPFIKVLDEYGAPVRTYSKRVGLPADAIYDTKGVIGEYCAWRFIDLASRYEKLDFFGYEAAVAYPINSIDGLGGLKVRDAHSLEQLLTIFFEDAQSESTGCQYSLIPTEDEQWLTRGKMFGDNHNNWQIEQYMIAIFIQIIRLCAGPKWLPQSIKSCTSKVAQPLPDEWKGIDFTWGSANTQIMIPTEILVKPLIESPSSSKTRDTTALSDSTPLTFNELVRTQIITNTIGVDNAAKQTGLSPKTLKRKLEAEGSSYSEILDQVRFSMAKTRLEETQMPITIIASELGYEHHANFTRAFKRICGITPQEYRNQPSH